MGLWSRILLFLRIRTSAALDQAEDPRQTLDYAYEQQQELLRRVKQGLVEVATSKRLLEQQTRKLGSQVPQLEDQARRAVNAGREDLARIALQRKQTALSELESLERQLADTTEEERKLTLAQQQLSARVDEFRMRRTALSARYSAAEAQVRISEALTGVSEEFAELGMAVGRAEEKIERLQARASAVDTLIQSGALSLPGSGGDLVERELRELSARQAVEEELRALKAQVEPGQPPSLLDGGDRQQNDRRKEAN